MSHRRFYLYKPIGDDALLHVATADVEWDRPQLPDAVVRDGRLYAQPLRPRGHPTREDAAAFAPDRFGVRFVEVGPRPRYSHAPDLSRLALEPEAA